MPPVYTYDPLELICASHNVKFIEYYYNDYRKEKYHSHGCPVCVGLIRAKVKFEFKRCSTNGKKRQPLNSIKANRGRKLDNGKKRGRPKVQASAATASQGIDIG